MHDYFKPVGFFGTSDLSLRMHYSRRTGFILVVILVVVPSGFVVVVFAFAA